MLVVGPRAPLGWTLLVVLMSPRDEIESGPTNGKIVGSLVAQQILYQGYQGVWSCGVGLVWPSFQ